MRRLDRPLGLGVNGPFQIGVFGLVNCLYNVELLFALLFLPRIVVNGTSGEGNEQTYSRLFGASIAAFRIYSWPSTYLFHRLMALRWSRLALYSETSSLIKR